MRKYETIFIINPDLNEEDTKGLIDRVRGIIESLRGEVFKIEEWGRKKLAYEVKKMSKGYFVLLHFAGTSQVLGELERNLRLMDGVLKYQTVRLDETEEKIAQMLSREKTSEKEDRPEPPTEESLQKVPEKEDVPDEVAPEQPPDAAVEAKEP